MDSAVGYAPRGDHHEKLLTFILIVAAVQAGTVTSAFAQQKPPAARHRQHHGPYRAQNDNHYTVFLVTPEGIIMSDPINRDFSRWLKSEIATRFKVPVRYVLYTHKDWDHASGGVVFADTAEFVGHANMRAGVALPPGNPPLPADAVKMDANRNGLIERSEATGQVAERFGLFDENGSGVLNGAELIRGSVNDVYPPARPIRDKHTVTLGGKRVMMVHLGTAHTDDGSVLYFPDERTVFSADVAGEACSEHHADDRGLHRRAAHHHGTRFRPRGNRPRAHGDQEGRRHVAAVSRGPGNGCRGGHRRRP